MVPGEQVVQAVAVQALQPEPQDTQLLLLESKKKPSAQAAHAVPLGALAHPVRQVQVPDELQEPFKQLHLEGALEGSGVERQAPVPDGPSSHLSQLLGHSGNNKSVDQYKEMKRERERIECGLTGAVGPKETCCTSLARRAGETGRTYTLALSRAGGLGGTGRGACARLDIFDRNGGGDGE